MKGIEDQADRDFLQKLLRQRESNPDLKIVAVESTPACAAGDNFMSDVTRLVVTVESIKRSSSEKSFLMKRQLSNQERREALKSDPAFRNEADVYQIIIPAFEEFSNRQLPFPECIHASKECVILGDLNVFGFKMADRTKGLNFKQTCLALKQLGIFHGISLSMKATEPKRFNSLSSVVQEFLFVPSNIQGFGDMLENALNVSIQGLRTSPKRHKTEIDPLIKKLENLRGTIFQKLFEIVCPKEPYNVICHGDFYINNLLFKSNNTGEPEEVAFVDLQAARHSTLATDFLYFIGSSLEKGLFLAHHETFLEIYHSGISEEISRNSPNSKNITLEMIKEEIKNSALFGLIMGFLLLQVVTAKPGAIDTSKDLSTPSIEGTLSFVGPEFFERSEDLVVTFDRLGYI